MILVTGASGSAGGTVLREVLKSGQPIRAMYRSQKDSAKSPEDVQAAIADFGDKASLARALTGVDTIYLVCSPVRELVDLEGNMVNACREAGVRHIVLNSAMRRTFRSHFRAGTVSWRTRSRPRAWDIRFSGQTASCRTS
jgi:uncharacterized protein YbjT (DUF2867 family)